MRSIFKRITCLFLALLTVVSLLPVMPLLTEAACSHSWGDAGKCRTCGTIFNFSSTRTVETGTIQISDKLWPMKTPYSAGAGGTNLKDNAGDKITVSGSVRYVAWVTNAYGKKWYEMRLEDGRTGYIYPEGQTVNTAEVYLTNVEIVLNNKYSEYNVSADPYSDAPKMTGTKIPAGTHGIATSIVKNVYGNCWYKVKINGIDGWVPADHCTVEGLAPDAVTVSDFTNFTKCKKDTDKVDLKEDLKATNCTITKITGALRSGETIKQSSYVTGSFTTFDMKTGKNNQASSGSNGTINLALTPRILAVGLYTYTLDVSVKVKIAEGKTIKDKTYDNIRVLSDSFEVYSGSASALTITLNANGGSCARKDLMAYSGKAIGSLPEPELVGKRFLGWYTAKTGGTQVTQNFTFTSNTTIYAHWGNDSFNVTYDANGGNGAPGVQTKARGQSLTLSQAEPVREYYEFKGWAKSKSATKPDYAKGGTYAYTTDADMTLYAVWEKLATYDMKYHANGTGVTGMPQNDQKIKDQKYTVSSVVPKRTGYIFKNWNTAADPAWNDPSIKPGDEYLVNQSVNFYAQWEPIEYEIEYDPNGGNGLLWLLPMLNTDHTYDKSKQLNTNNYWKSGYEFNGWNTKADGSGKSYKEAESVKNLSSKDGDVVTLYAQWKKKGETPKETKPAPAETKPAPKETQPVTKPTEPPKDPTPAKTLPNQTVRIPSEAEVPKNQKSPASYKPAQTYDDVEAIVMDYWNTVTNYGQNKAYWNNHIRAKNTTKTEPFLNTITRTPCTHTPTHYHTGGTCPGSKSNESGCTHGCTSNGFWYSDNNYQAQCEGFSYYMAWVVFGKLHTDTTAYTRIDRTALSADYKIKPGDILRAKWNWSIQEATHSMFVYKIENGIAYYIECNYSDTAPSGCRIFNKRSLNAKKMVEILRETPGGYIISSKAVPSLKSYNIKFDANKPSGAKNPTGTMEDQKGWIGGKTYLNPNTFAIKGYVFDGWNTSADGSGKKFLDKATIAQNLTEKEGDTVTLYAQWKAQDQVKYPTNLEFVLNEKYDSYNVYAEPYSDSVTRNSTEIPAGTHGIATEIVKNSHDNWWYHVNINGIDGWISGDNCDPVGAAPQAVTINDNTHTNLSRYRSGSKGIDLTEQLKANSCVITKITGALTDCNGNVQTSTNKIKQQGEVKGPFTEGFDVKTGANKALNNSSLLTPTKLTKGLYQYTLDVDVTVKVIEGNAMKDKPFDLHVLTDPFEVHEGTATSLTITLDPKGGSCHQKEILVYKDDPIGELPEPVFVGKTFLGWYTAAEDGEKVTEKNTFSKNTTLYARWSSAPKQKEKVYTVVYDPNGGTGTTKESSHVVGAYAPLTKNGFTRSGYDFDGWAINAAGTGQKLSDGQEIVNLTYTDGATVKLYATWKLSAGEEYLKLCTQYPSHMKLTVSSLAGKLLTAPHYGGESLRVLFPKETLISTALYQNSKGEYWYQVRANLDGKVGYVYAGNTNAVDIANKNVSFGVYLKSTSVLRGYSCDILGSVSASYNILHSVTGVLDDSDPTTDPHTQRITEGFDNVFDTELNRKLPFAQLSRGKGTLKLTATLKSYYSDGRTLSWKTHTTGEHSLDFRVIGVYNVVYNKNTDDSVLYMPSWQNKTDLQELKLSANVPAREGYTFLGWAKEEDAEKPDYRPNDFLREDTDTGNLNLYALWAGPNQYTITFDPNGGTGGPTKATATYGKSFYYPKAQPTQTNCTFLGWSTNKDADGNANNAGDYLLEAPLKFKRDTTLYAVWKRNVVEIRFHHNDGTERISIMKVLAGEEFDLPVAAQFNRPGYILQGYAGTADAAAAQSLPGAPFTTNTAQDLYLIWKEKTWTVTYRENGGMDAPDPQEKRKDVDLTLSGEPYRFGFVFEGWSGAADSREILYRPGDTYTANEDIVLYAVWSENNMGAATYRVTYDANGGVGAPEPQTKVSGVDLQVSQQFPTRDGYYCMGWATTPDAQMPNVGGLYTEDREITFYAVWKKDSSEQVTYTVTFDANGGYHAPEPQTKLHGVDLLLSVVEPRREGKQFIGWAHDPGADMPSVSNYYRTDESVTLYAVWWDLGGYNLYYEANGGQGGMDWDFIQTNEPMILTTDVPTREGYLFAGWSEDPDAETADYFPNDVFTQKRDLTLYAVWEENTGSLHTYEVVFDLNGGILGPQRAVKIQGRDLPLPDFIPVRPHCRFLGWAKHNDAALPDFPVTGDWIYKEDAETTLYALWEKITYTVTYNPNGGTGCPADQIKYSGTPLTITTEIPTRKGFEFMGWGTNPEGYGVDYLPGDNYEQEESLTLYAIWKRAESLIFDANAGTYWVFDYETVETKSCEPFDLSNLCHIVITVNPSEEIRMMYSATEDEPDRSIQDWYDENCPSGNILGAPLKVADGKLDFYVSQDSYPIQIGSINTGLNSLQVRTDEEIELEVQQVTLHANGGTFGIGATELVCLESPSHPLIRGGTGFEIPLRDGYTHVGWATSADAAIASYDTSLQYEDVAPEVTCLYAVWQMN